MSANAASAPHTIDRLTPGNYAVWKLRVKMVLVERDLWQATMDATLKSDDKNSAKALAIIVNTIADDQLIHVDGADTANAAWIKLAAVHEAKGTAAKTFLLRKLLTL